MLINSVNNILPWTRSLAGCVCRSLFLGFFDTSTALSEDEHTLHFATFRAKVKRKKYNLLCSDFHSDFMQASEHLRLSRLGSFIVRVYCSSNTSPAAFEIELEIFLHRVRFTAHFNGLNCRCLVSKARR